MEIMFVIAAAAAVVVSITALIIILGDVCLEYVEGFIGLFRKPRS